jgi:hypothetical protein
MKAYPKRPDLFCVHYVKWLIRSGVANQAGPDAFALLVAVVYREDEIFYQRPPNYFNEQLAKDCGIGSVPALIRARKRAVSLGLLEYIPGAKRRPGTYFVDGFPNELLPNPDKCSNESLPKAEGKRKESGRKAEGKRKENDTLQSLSCPSSIPKRESTKFSPPTVEQVQEYIKQNGIDIDAATFVDWNMSKGWRVGSEPMRDWKAAVRTWWRRQQQFKQVETEKPITTNPIRSLAERARKPK